MLFFVVCCIFHRGQQSEVLGIHFCFELKRLDRFVRAFHPPPLDNYLTQLARIFVSWLANTTPQFETPTSCTS